MKRTILTAWVIGFLLALSLPVFGQTKPGLYDGDAFQGEWSFADYTEWLKTYAKDGGNYTIVLGKDEAISGVVLDYNKKQVTITLKPSGGGRMIQFGKNDPSLFAVKAGITFMLEEGLTFSGAGVNNSKTLVIVDGGTFIMNGGTLKDTKDSAVRVNAGEFTMNGGVISGNFASYNNGWGCGGGVYVGEGTFRMNGGVISKNSSASGSLSNQGGGGVYISQSGHFIMNAGIISENSARNGGGVVVAGTFTMSDGIISKNTASRGGGIDVDNGHWASGVFTMKGGRIIENTADQGGGVYSDNQFIMDSGVISGNTAKQDGGGVFVGDNYSEGIFTMNGGTITENIAGTGRGKDGYGGGVRVKSSKVFTMNGGTISKNMSSIDGGGVSVTGSFVMNNGVISGNTSASRGGGVWVYGKFTKSSTAGTIYGSDAPSEQANKAKSDEVGHAVWAGENRIRNTTAGETIALDNSKNRFEGGGWGE